MCGITGIIQSDPLSNKQLQSLQNACQSLTRRGPNDEGIHTSSMVGLGHRRLSILDLSQQGHQPMTDASGRYVIVFNGEIFNFKVLRNELISKGYAFHSETDTEVLLNGWDAWKLDLLPKLNGFFAFAIYDKSSTELYLVRDRYGIKPLYYTYDNNTLIFGSELKALLAFDIPRELDKTALNLYFQLTYIPAPYTIYQQVKKLSPGHLIYWKGGKIQIQSYYQLPAPAIGVYQKTSDAIIALRDTLSDAVNIRLISDVPLGTFLSGGIDSSIISALAARNVSKLNTFSIGFKDKPFFDETQYALMVAKQYNTHHHVFSLTDDDLLRHVDEAIGYFDEPFADSSALPVFILSKLTKQHVTVALSGDGADELFGGYNKHRAWMMAAHGGWKNAAIKALAPITSILPQSRNSKFSNMIRQVNRYAGIIKQDLPYRYWSLARFQDEVFCTSLLKSKWHESLDPFLESTISIPNEDINYILLQDVKQVLAGDMLPKVDLMSMANSLEVRVPFLDYRVVQLAFAISQQDKIKGNTGKWILREAFKDMLPSALFQRGKHGFEVPLLDWFKTSLHAQLDHEVFNHELIEAQGIFEPKAINFLKQKLHSRNPGDSPVAVWQLLVFQRWWKHFHLNV